MSTAPSTAAASTATPLVVTVYLPCSSPLSSNSTTTQSTTTESSSVFNLFYIGLIMALGQSVLNGFNYLFNKMAQNRVARSGPSAAEGSFRYCCQPLWWLSLLLMFGAEGCNFAAYIFASATVVAPMGALSVVASAVIAALFLRERLNVLGQLGAGLCLVGTTLIVVFAPQTTAVTRIDELAHRALNPVFLVYLGIVVVGNVLLIFFAYPRWGMHIPFIPITTTASMGSLTVCSSVGIGIALKRSVVEDSSDIYPWTFWFTYIIFVAIIIAISTQIIFLNKSLAAYNVNLVCPILYVEFTSLSILATAILYGDWSGLGYQNIVAIVMGFLVTIAGMSFSH